MDRWSVAVQRCLLSTAINHKTPSPLTLTRTRETEGHLLSSPGEIGEEGEPAWAVEPRGNGERRFGPFGGC